MKISFVEKNTVYLGVYRLSKEKIAADLFLVVNPNKEMTELSDMISFEECNPLNLVETLQDIDLLLEQASDFDPFLGEMIKHNKELIIQETKSITVQEIKEALEGKGVDIS